MAESNKSFILLTQEVKNLKDRLQAPSSNQLKVDYSASINIDLNNAPTVIDGSILSISQITYFLYGQTNQAENGIYRVISLSPNVLGRVIQFQSYETINNSRIFVAFGGQKDNDFFAKIEGEPTSFVLNTTPIIITEADDRIENLETNKMDKNFTANEGDLAFFDGDGNVKTGILDGGNF